MTELLEKALVAARSLSEGAQDEIARTILLLAEQESEPILLTAEERAAIEASKAAAARDDFASDDEVQAVWAKYGL